MKLDRAVRTLWAHELRLLIRDRRTVIASVILPIATMPLLMFAGTYSQQRRERALEAGTFDYALVGPLAEELAAELATLPPKKPGLARVAVDPAAIQESVRDRQVHVAAETLTGAEADARPKDTKDETDPEEEAATADKAVDVDVDVDEQSDHEDPKEEHRLQGVPVVRLYFRGDDDASRRATDALSDALEELRKRRVQDVLAGAGFKGDPEKAGAITSVDVATEKAASGATIGRFLALVFIFLLLTGASVAALDIIAGEKERGTLETLLTTAAGRTQIVAAKLLAIITVAVVITAIQGANLLAYLVFRLVELPASLVSPLTVPGVLVLVTLLLPLAALVAAVLLLISGYARSFKEAQLYFFPVYLIGIALGSASVLPGAELRSPIVLVPVSNLAVAAREVLSGRFDWPMLALCFLIMAATASYAVMLCARTLSAERLVGAFEDGSGPTRWSVHAPRWFMAMWAVLLVASLNLPDIRLQLAFNQLVVFLAVPLLIVRIYGLAPREVFSLKAPRPAVWFATALLAPACTVLAIGLFDLFTRVVPVPPEAAEELEKALLGHEPSLLEQLVGIALLPAICEELTFRGLLLYALRKRREAGPVGLVLIVGLTFGLFHFMWFRIIPTAFLGMILTALTLATGSIFPSMFLHAVNNTLALLTAQLELDPAVVPPALYGVAFGMAGLATWILWRTTGSRARTPS